MRSRSPRTARAEAIQIRERDWQKRRYLVAQLRAGGLSMRRIAERLAMSVGFVHKWCTRLQQQIEDKRRGRKISGTKEALASLSSRPKNPRRKKHLHREKVEMLRSRHPFMGAEKMVRMYGLELSHQSVYEITVESGQLIPGRKARRVWRAFQRKHSNSLWQMDIKEFEKGAYMVSAIDDHSRFVIGAMVRRTMTTDDVLEFMENAIATFGAPRQILTDHGTQWTTKRGGRCRFDHWCDERGIEHIRGQVRKPTTQGKIERFHRTVLDEAPLPPEGSSPEDYQDAVNRFVEWYNAERPHWALGLSIPVNVYMADFKNPDSFTDLGVHEVS